MLASILSIYLLALLQPIFHPFDRNRIGWLLAVLPIILFWYYFSFLTPNGFSPIQESYSWVPSLGIQLSFYLDSLSMVFVLLILGIGSLVFIYSGSYLKKDSELNRYYSFLLIFMGSMLGLVLSNNIILAFVFWELTSISSYLLIGYHHEEENARSSAQKALIVTSAGGLAMMVGILLMGSILKSYELSQLLQHPGALIHHEMYGPILILIALGCFAKSAQFPFHFWLPGAMVAPTPVSAYLHSATMVNAGIYLLARLSPLLAGTQAWFWLLSVTGGITMLLGAVLAIFQHDLKKILAYSTLSVLGMMVHLLGLGHPAALKAVLLLLVAHALYKASLFLIAGVIDHQYHTRDIRKLKALAPSSLWLTLAAALAALSSMGLPPLFGFVAKEALLEAEQGSEFLHLAWMGAALLASMFLVAAGLLVGFFPFWRGIKKLPQVKEKAELSLILGPLLLAGLGLWYGLEPQRLEPSLLNPAFQMLTGQPEGMGLASFHGPSLTLFLSIAAMVGGALIFALRITHLNLHLHSDVLHASDPDHIYQEVETGLGGFAHWLTCLLQTGQLRHYLIWIIGFVLITGTFTLWPMLEKFSLHLGSAQLWDWAIVGIMIFATILCLIVQRFLQAVLCLGVVGFGVVLLFALYSAPDLALTQLLVETLTLVLFVLMLKKLPHFASHSSQASRWRDALFSGAFGLFITLLLWVAPFFADHDPISEYYVDNAEALGHGSNVVNVILVDFRGLDTLGEITVLAIAGIGVYGLLKLKPKDTP